MKRFNGKSWFKEIFQKFSNYFVALSFSLSLILSSPQALTHIIHLHAHTCTHTHAHHTTYTHSHAHSFNLFLMKQIRNRLRKVLNFFQTLKILCNLEWSRNCNCSQSFASLIVLIALQSVMHSFLHSVLILSLLMLFYPLSDRVHYEQI